MFDEESMENIREKERLKGRKKRIPVKVDSVGRSNANERGLQATVEG